MLISCTAKLLTRPLTEYVWRSMTEYDVVWRSMTEYDGVAVPNCAPFGWSSLRQSAPPRGRVRSRPRWRYEFQRQRAWSGAHNLSSQILEKQPIAKRKVSCRVTCEELFVFAPLRHPLQFLPLHRGQWDLCPSVLCKLGLSSQQNLDYS